jgi:hypothetical protein
MLTKRVFAGIILLGKQLADDYIVRAIEPVLRGKDPPLQQRHLDGTEVAGVGLAGHRKQVENLAGRGTFRNREYSLAFETCSGSGRNQTGSDHTRQVTDFLQQGFVKGNDLSRRVILDVRKPIPHRQHAIRSAAQVG